MEMVLKERTAMVKAEFKADGAELADLASDMRLQPHSVHSICRNRHAARNVTSQSANHATQFVFDPKRECAQNRKATGSYEHANKGKGR